MVPPTEDVTGEEGDNESSDSGMYAIDLLTLILTIFNFLLTAETD